MSDKSAATFEAWKREYTPKRVPVEDICLDGDLALRLKQAQEELSEFEADKKTKTLAESNRLRKVVAELQDEAATKQHSFVFKSIGRKAWQDLKSEYPPNDEQKERGMDFDPMTFMEPAAVKACCEIDGEETTMSPDMGTWLFENLSNEDITRIYTACLDANELRAEFPKAVTANPPRGAKK